MYVIFKVWQSHGSPGEEYLRDVCTKLRSEVCLSFHLSYMYLSSPSKQLEFSESLNRSNLVLCYLFTLVASLLLHAKSLQSCLTLCDPMDCGPPGSLSIGYSRQEYWSGLLCPPPGYLPDPGIKPRSLMSPASAGRFLTINTTGHIFIFPSYLRGETVFGGQGEAVGG